MDEQQDDAAELPVSFRYNFDTLDDYIATSEKIGQDGRLEEAVDVMREGARRFPESARAHQALGLALLLALKADIAVKELWEFMADEEELAEEAHEAFQAAIGRDPELWDAYANLGTLLVMRGRTAKAVEVWEKSLELNPDQPDVKGDLEMVRGRITEEGGTAKA